MKVFHQKVPGSSHYINYARILSARSGGYMVFSLLIHLVSAAAVLFSAYEFYVVLLGL